MAANALSADSDSANRDESFQAIMMDATGTIDEKRYVEEMG